MRGRLYHVDAFTTRNFSGNPAAGVVLAAYPSSEVMQAVAAENNLPENGVHRPWGGGVSASGGSL